MCIAKGKRWGDPGPAKLALGGISWGFTSNQLELCVFVPHGVGQKETAAFITKKAPCHSPLERLRH